MEKTLYDALISLAEENPRRFHMPGHKGRDVLGVKSAAIDFTEINGLDNLHSPNGIIARSEQLAAELFGARRSFFLVNGSSSGIIASVLALTEERKPVVCARNSHISVFKGLCLSGAKPVYIAPECIERYGVCGGISPQNIEVALKASGANAVFIVSPTAEGFTSDIRKIADITHKHGAFLVVDEAHGAHFKFGRSFPETALSQGADVVIQSWHKTLAALGQGSVLHLNYNGLDEERFSVFLSLMQTTSPSYVIMASLDRNRQILEENGEALFARYEKNLKYLRSGLSKIKGVERFSGDMLGDATVGLDPGKITLYARGSGKELDAFLRERGIYAEMSMPDYVVLMTSFMDRKRDYYELIEAVADFSPQAALADGTCRTPPKIPPAAHTPRECLKRQSRAIPLRAAAGMVSAGFITPYPPGVPYAAPGEILTEEIVEYCLKLYGKIEINGISNEGTVKVML